MRGKEVLTFIVSATTTLIIALAVIRYFAPQLLGLPVDLQMVRVAEEVPPFFAGIFRDDDFSSKTFIIKDPEMHRAKPLYLGVELWGPHDLLGFRNRSIPVVADIVTIGDSMTYGMGAILEESWPQQVGSMLAGESPVVYNMAIGGWGAAEYLRIFPRALRFRPRVVAVAFYTGNDPRDTLGRAYNRPELAFLRPDLNVHPSDLPRVNYPAPKEEWWKAEFGDGFATIFTPKLWHTSNLDHPAIRVAYSIMADVARRIREAAAEAGVGTVFTIIPTKALVLAPRVEADGLEATAEYLDLIRDERRHVEEFAERLRAIPGAVYVDLLAPLQQAGLRSVAALYHSDTDSHPRGGGHQVIARALAPAIDRLLPARPDGAVRVVYDQRQKKDVYAKDVFLRGDPEHLYRFLLIREGRVWSFRSEQVFEANGWRISRLPSVSPRDIANLPHAGVIETVDPERFGPDPSI